MEVIYLNENNLKHLFKEEISLCLGFFDGLHLGHQALIKKAKQSPYKSALLTFSNPFKREKILTSLDDKKEILNSYSLNYLFVLEFNEKIKHLKKEDFIEKILLKLNVKEVIVGKDYHFGYNSSGDISTLKTYQKYFDTKVLDFVYFKKQKISTSLINELLDSGNIKDANFCLSRNYKIKGQVIEGKGNGHLINYPTANIKLLEKYKLPRRGVYKTYAYIANKKYLAMTNIGIHPTISPLKDELIEVHIIDQNMNLYNQIITIEFIDYLREEKKFSSFEELKIQLDKDKLQIKLSENLSMEVLPQKNINKNMN